MSPAAGLTVVSKHSFSRKLSAHDVPSSAYGEISAVLGANFRALSGAVELTENKRCSGSLAEVWHFQPCFQLVQAGAFKDTAVPETGGENVSNPPWPNRRSYGSLQPPATAG